ncbi:MAG: hypothetical protein HY319_20820 [Armatimonadetes bacterium]|nr:hypothetical protein [Armatimonadota bacterium]
MELRWIFLWVGLGALVLALVLWQLSRHVRRRWKQGREALAELRRQARDMRLEMEETASDAPDAGKDSQSAE